jgi:hypothetical protein
MKQLASLLVLLCARAFATAPQEPIPVEGDFTIRGFRFESGEELPELKLHYLCHVTKAVARRRSLRIRPGCRDLLRRTSGSTHVAH